MAVPSRLRYDRRMTCGCDYASVDGNNPPNFAAAYAWGIRFVLIRGAYTYNGRAYVDTTLARDRAPAHAAGMIVGAYLILSYDPSGPSPEMQAQTFIDAYGEVQAGELPVSIDAETNSNDHSASTDAQRLDWVQRAYDVLLAKYGIVMTYTSQNQWSENFGDGPSEIGDGPLWIKVPYPWNADQPPHPEDVPPIGTIPAPWRAAGSPGGFIEQIQGDAKGVPGFSSTGVLSNVFLYYKASATDPRTPWVVQQLVAAGELAGPTTDAALINNAIRGYQAAQRLGVDGTIGPATFAPLAREGLS